MTFLFGQRGMSLVAEHRFASKADAAASKTYPKQALWIRDGEYIVINNRPCKVLYGLYCQFGRKGIRSCNFFVVDLFTLQRHDVVVPASQICDVPYVNYTDYQLIDISEDGFVSLCTESGGINNDVRLPTRDDLRTLIKDGFAEGKHLVVTVLCAMGEEHICEDEKEHRHGLNLKSVVFWKRRRRDEEEHSHGWNLQSIVSARD